MKVPYTMTGKRGDTVYQRNRYGQISYKAFTPFNPRSSAQRFVRANFTAVSRRWRKLTEEQRLVWCAAAKAQLTRSRLGKRFPMRGFYYFVRVNVALANRGLPQLDLPPADRVEQPSAPLLTRILVQYDRLLLKPEAVPPELRPFLKSTAIWAAWTG